MKKLTDKILFKFIELKVWLHQKKNGTTWDMFQFGLFWMLIMILISMLIGKILWNILNSLCDIPFRITSGYRSEDHNRKVGGVLGSSHTKGLAADIACTNSAARHIIVTALLKVGLNRIGIADTFIHVDRDPSKVANVIWTY